MTRDPVIIACLFLIGMVAFAAALDIRAERDLRALEAIRFTPAPAGDRP